MSAIYVIEVETERTGLWYYHSRSTAPPYGFRYAPRPSAAHHFTYAELETVAIPVLNLIRLLGTVQHAKILVHNPKGVTRHEESL